MDQSKSSVEIIQKPSGASSRRTCGTLRGQSITESLDQMTKSVIDSHIVFSANAGAEARVDEPRYYIQHYQRPQKNKPAKASWPRANATKTTRQSSRCLNPLPKTNQRSHTHLIEEVIEPLRVGRWRRKIWVPSKEELFSDFLQMTCAKSELGVESEKSWNIAWVHLLWITQLIRNIF